MNSQHHRASSEQQVVAFVRARLNEDEAEAIDWRDHDVDSEATRFGTHRIFADIRAHRAIVDRYEYRLRDRDPIKPMTVGLCSAAYEAVTRLAAIWQDHHDYDPAWRPTDLAGGQQ